MILLPLGIEFLLGYVCGAVFASVVAYVFLKVLK